jgi:hypothetical protein
MDAGWAIGASGLLISCVQLWLGDRRQRFDNTSRLIERFQARDARTDRFSIDRLMEKSGPSQDFSLLSDEECAQLSGIAAMYGYAGLLMRRRRLVAEIFLDAYARSVVTNFKRLSTYRSWSDARLGGAGALWTHFEWLNDRAASHLRLQRSES